jgi:hypothetical protein
VTGPGRPVLRRLGRGAALVAIIALASVVLRTAPVDSAWQVPFEVHGEAGDRVEGRNIAATVGDVALARTVTASSGWSGATTGIWVVVDVQVEAVVTETAASLATAQLVLGEDTYGASERPGTATVAGTALQVGIPWRGPLLFEVPPDAVVGPYAAEARIQLAASGDTRLDSVLVVPVDLDGLVVQDTITTDAPELVGPA